MEALLETLKQGLDQRELLETTYFNIVHFLQTEDLPDWAKDSVFFLIKNRNWEELNDRFFKTIAFGTAGMRGRMIGKVSTPTEKDGDTYVHPAVGTCCMNDFNVILTTLGLFNYCRSYLETNCEFQRRPNLVIAHDSRYFSRHFCELAASTWTRMGGDAYIFDGPRSTPQLSYSVRHLKTIAGVMITASHNPYFDNGYKVYFCDGAQINADHAQKITRQIEALSYEDAIPYLDTDFRDIFHLSPLVDEAYFECCQEAILDLHLFKTLKTTKVVYTPLHGTGSVTILPSFKNYDWNVFPVESQMKMDGAFPTVTSPNPDNIETLKLALEEAKKNDADCIIATDPDGDRMSAMLKDKSGQWNLLNGNTIAILLAEYRWNTLQKLKRIPENTSNIAVIKSFVTTPLLDCFAKKNGLKLIETHTGFKWIGEKLNDYETILKDKLGRMGLVLDYTRCSYRARSDLMLKYSTFFFLGAEESCGFLSNDAVRDKDANAAVLMFCEFIAYLKSKKLSYIDYLNEIYTKYGYFKEELLSFTFEGSNGAKKIQHLMQSYRQNTPKRVNDSRLLTFSDFSTIGLWKDADGKVIPESNFLIFRLLNGCSIAIRPSGTEPKIKLYLFGQEEVQENEQLSDVKHRVDERVKALKAWFQADVEKRSK